MNAEDLFDLPQRLLHLTDVGPDTGDLAPECPSVSLQGLDPALELGAVRGLRLRDSLGLNPHLLHSLNEGVPAGP